MKSSIRVRADAIKAYRCKNLIAVLENPDDIRNIGTVIRNVNALGVEKTYIVDSRKSLPEDWQEMRERRNEDRSQEGKGRIIEDKIKKRKYTRITK